MEALVKDSHVDPYSCFYNIIQQKEKVFYFLCSTFEVVQAAFLEVGVLGCIITDPVKVNNSNHFTTLSCNIANDIDVLTQILSDIKLEL